MNQTTNKEQEERQKVTQICQELTQSEAVLFELLVNAAFALFVSRYPVQDTKKRKREMLVNQISRGQAAENLNQQAGENRNAWRVRRKEIVEMELGRLHNQEILSISDSDIQNILEYKISRTEDKRLILEIKMDISNSLLQIGTLTTEKESIQEKTLQQVQ